MPIENIAQINKKDLDRKSLLESGVLSSDEINSIAKESDLDYKKYLSDTYDSGLSISDNSKLSSAADNLSNDFRMVNIDDTGKDVNNIDLFDKSSGSDISGDVNKLKKNFSVEEIRHIPADGTNEKMFMGLSDTDENIDSKVSQWAKNLYDVSDQSDLISNIIAPWDRRLGDAYTSTQSIGNYMPFGPEWVGSPSLFNQYALIRFDHVAGEKHHKFLFDQYGQTDFRTIGYAFPKMNINDVGGEKILMKETTSNQEGESSYKIVEIEGEKYNQVNSEQYNQINNSALSPGSNVYVDFEGNLFQFDVNNLVEVWAPTYPEKIPAEEKNSSLEIQILLSSAGDTNEPRPGTQGNTSTFSQDKVVEYWSSKKGLVRCESTHSLIIFEKWTLSSICSALSEGQEINEKDMASAAAELEKARKYVQDQIDAGWRFKSNLNEKKYLKQSNTEPLNRKELEPTFDNLCNFDNWKGNEQFAFDWVDFLYTSDFGFYPNNRLLTLRRFPVPIGDNGRIPDQDDSGNYISPVAKAVTWMDEDTGNSLSSFLTFEWKMNWKPLEAEVNKVTGNEMGADSQGGPFQGFAKALGLATGEANFGSISGYDAQRAQFDPYEDGPYANQPYGPVNVITKTQTRDTGLIFEHSIIVKFSYTSKAIGGVNQKAAMLDIISNFLALTYNNAAFWGGAIRYFPNKPAYPFLGAKKGMQAWYNGDVSGFVDAVGDQFTKALGNLGDMLMNFFSNPMEAIKKLATGGTKLWMAKKQSSERPNILSFKSLLTGEPIGEWHLMVGNPFNPIAMIGNLIVDSTKIVWSEDLTADDFPEKVMFEVSLQHGKPRDKSDIESMFNRGNGRLYYSYYGKKTEPWNTASSTKHSNSTRAPNAEDIDQNTGFANGLDRYPKGALEESHNAPYSSKKSQTLEMKTDPSEQYYTANHVKTDLLVQSSEAELATSSPLRMIRKSYNAGSKKAFELAEKIGFKHSGEDDFKK